MPWNCPKSLCLPPFILLLRSVPGVPCLNIISGIICSKCKFRTIASDSKQAAEKLHIQLLKDGKILNTYASNKLLALYARSEVISHYANRLFDDIPRRDVRTWTTLISSYAKRGHFQTAAELLKDMQSEGVKPNKFTLASILSCCSNLSQLAAGKEIHGWALKNMDCLDVILENAILDVYIKCKEVDLAAMMFKLIESKDTSSWNIMIGGYISAGYVNLAQELFDSLAIKDVVTWNAMIGGLMRHGLKRKALKMLYRMVEEGPEVNQITISIAANLVSWLGNLLLGKQIHAYGAKFLRHSDDFLNNSLIDMYCKCEKMGSAYMLFRMHPEKALWSSIVNGYLRNHDFKRGVQSFRLMMEAQIHLDEFTLSCIISSCGKEVNLALGAQIHCVTLKTREHFDAFTSSSLIDMYAKCGCLGEARRIFEECMNNRNVISFTAIICGCAFNGEGKEALTLFDLMLEEKILPNEVTFLGVLTACSHAGMAEESIKYLEEMQRDWRIKPGIDHYTCVVDTFARSGRLNEAKTFILERGLYEFASVWNSLLTFCRLYKDDEMEKWISKVMSDSQELKVPGLSRVHFQYPFVGSP